MKLLQKRDFSALFTDSFQFAKENAAHFFLNFFIINGLLILTYAAYNHYSSRFIYGGEGMEIFGVIVLILIALSAVYWTFYPTYMILYKEKGIQFDASDIVGFMSQNIGKIMVYILLSLFMGIVLLIPLILLTVLLAITIVGIFLLPVLFAFFMLWFSLTYYEYLNTEKSYFESFGYSFSMLMNNFWATTGSNALLQFIIIILQYLLLGVFGFFSIFADISTGNQDALENLQTFMSSPSMMIISAVVLVISSLVHINSGIIYFSQKEQLEGISEKLNIDEIGRND